MPFFPMFVDLEDKRILVVGGGRVASRKVANLLPFNPKIYVVAETATDYLVDLSKKGALELNLKSFEMRDLKNVDIVIVAVDDVSLQRTLYEYCRKRLIPINCVDSPSYCSFIFPSLINEGDLVIGISTSGKAPIVSKRIKEKVLQIIPRDIDKVIKKIANIRKSKLNGKDYLEKIVKEEIP